MGIETIHVVASSASSCTLQGVAGAWTAADVQTQKRAGMKRADPASWLRNKLRTRKFRLDDSLICPGLTLTISEKEVPVVEVTHTAKSARCVLVLTMCFCAVSCTYIMQIHTHPHALF